MAVIDRGAMLLHDRNLVLENGGHLSFSNDQARHIIYKVTKDEKKTINYLGNPAARPNAPAILSKTKLDFQQKIKHAKEEYNIPGDLIIDFEQKLLVYIWL